MPVYKNKQRNSWYCSFYYRDYNGVRKRKKKEGFSTKRAAREYELNFLSRFQGKSDMLFRCLAGAYLADCKNRCKPTSYQEKKYIIESKILPYFGNMPVNEIQSSTIRLWQNQFLSACKPNGRPYSPTYLKSIHVQLSAVFNYGARYWGISPNPASLCGSMGKKKAPPMHFWTLTEFNAFLEGLKDAPLSRLIFQVLFWTGIRSGELLALSISDIDFQKSQLSITKNYCRFQGKDLILTPKTPKSIRTVTIPAFLKELLREYVRKHPGSNEKRLFPVTKYYLTAEMKRGCANSGVSPIRIHDLRHSHASLLIELGASPLLISERLGHEKVETTLQTYSHLYPDKQAAMAASLDRLYNGTL